MLIKHPPDVLPSEITDRAIYQGRRTFIRSAGLLVAAAGLGLQLDADAGQKLPALRPSPYSTTESLTPYKDVTGYCNFYEFGTSKTDPPRLAASLRTRPWTVQVDGLVKRPATWDIDALLKLAPLEERIYRMRCVEGWSMVIPWAGYSLNQLIRRAEPLGSAKYVEFTTLFDPAQMPGQRSSLLHWPYVEGLRLDEAMHPLTLLCLGLYGEVLPNQNGAPVRIVVPWKYGYKSAKSIVRIRFVEEQPITAWARFSPREFGFYANVNPEIDHPWSQAREHRFGDFLRRKTLPFNGYGEQVAGLYRGMDLRRYF